MEITLLDRMRAMAVTRDEEVMRHEVGTGPETWFWDMYEKAGEEMKEELKLEGEVTMAALNMGML